jgi:hypothetical protein
MNPAFGLGMASSPQCVNRAFYEGNPRRRRFAISINGRTCGGLKRRLENVGIAYGIGCAKVSIRG